MDLNERALQLRTGGQREADEEGNRFGEGGNFQGSRRYGWETEGYVDGVYLLCRFFTE